MNKTINSLSISEIMQLIISNGDFPCLDKTLRKSLQAKKLLTKDGKITTKGRRVAKFMLHPFSKT